MIKSIAAFFGRLFAKKEKQQLPAQPQVVINHERKRGRNLAAVHQLILEELPDSFTINEFNTVAMRHYTPKTITTMIIKGYILEIGDGYYKKAGNWKDLVVANANTIGKREPLAPSSPPDTVIGKIVAQHRQLMEITAPPLYPPTDTPQDQDELPLFEATATTASSEDVAPVVPETHQTESPNPPDKVSATRGKVLIALERRLLVLSHLPEVFAYSEYQDQYVQFGGSPCTKCDLTPLVSQNLIEKMGHGLYKKTEILSQIYESRKS